ncbi:MAG: serpin family protein [Bacteroidales bacterium]|nr:MAG: serpin family protein [Bacteroidales bacterium]
MIILVVNQGCKKETTQPTHEPKAFILPAKSAGVITKSNKFGIELFTKTAKVDDGNLMLSPLSASVALTMLLNGSKNNTYNQIHQMLGYEGLSQIQVNEVYRNLVSQLLEADSNVKLAIANAVWYRNGFTVKPTFLEVMNNDFSAHVEGLDFTLPSALTTINKWASDNTYGKIPEVLNEISADVVMFLMNALYFKGIWTYQFDKAKTQREAFHKGDGSDIMVDMMHLSLNANVFTNDNFRALELTYGRTNFSMIIILPTGSIDDLFESFSNDDWNSISNHFNAATNFPEWSVSLPKFKFSYEKLLNDQLISLGMIDAFSPENANLSGIADADLFVDFVKQNTFIEVNEEGTEAAAVTTIGIKLTSTPDVNSFIVDKPFVFAIRERTTNTILFMGKVVDPRYSN